MPTLTITANELDNYLGREIGTSGWMEISQSRINKFAEATGDFQWIHVDVERARTEMPGGKTIAHGYLVLSLVPQFFDGLISITGLRYGLNYGLNKVRFTSPVPVDSRVRAMIKLTETDHRKDNTILATFSVVMNREGQERPVMLAEMLVLLAPAG
ncbi:MaoC family dehydratase [Emcibacter sp.]|uniref:MaoC family dehydratase n=1 Tax=Emcibacter sp. TaxID=1979954 RepID=UPI002AA6E24B|nr:MaoC family dehydratase [Emcibacter sp.]